MVYPGFRGVGGLKSVGDRIEHCRHFLWIVTSGALGLQAADPVGDGALASAKFFDALGGERDASLIPSTCGWSA
jgi:hypothetical protein